MKNLKNLREASGNTQAQIAAMLGTTQQTYARWEAGKVSPPIPALRELALIFSTTVDHLLGRGPSKAPSTRYHLIAGDADGFWGHLGLLLPGSSHTKWYPITAGEASNIRRRIAAGYNVDDWIVAHTLNNRVLIFTPKKMLRVQLLEDACDSPKGDWNWTAPWNDQNGIPIELYKAMDDWLDGQQEFERNNLEPTREKALTLIEQGGFLHAPDGLAAHLHNTAIHLSDGTEISYEADRSDLSLLPTELEGDTDLEVVSLSASEGEGESYYAVSMLRLIELPLIELEAALAELED